MRHACPRCGAIAPHGKTHCPEHQPNPNAHRSPGRDRAKQARFRTLVLARDGYRCQHCGSTTDLRACHIIPLAQGGSYDPGNGITRCRTHDMATDPYAR